jgi:hypothetical protein
MTTKEQRRQEWTVRCSSCYKRAVEVLAPKTQSSSFRGRTAPTHWAPLTVADPRRTG